MNVSLHIVIEVAEFYSGFCANIENTQLKMLIRLTSTIIFVVLCLSAYASSPELEDKKESDYILGSEEELQMVVHIWGEVRSPGEHQVSYNMNLVELISTAGGPTKDAKLSKVQLTRQATDWSLDENAIESIVKDSQDNQIDNEELKRKLATASRKIIYYDVERYLGDKDMLVPPPVLQPGDVVHVKTNSWYWWREMIRVVHEVALIASIYAWYLRSN